VQKRVFKVLLPTALPPDAKAMMEPANTESKEAASQKRDNAMTSATFVIAFNATDSMAPFAKQIAQDIRTAFESLPPEIQKASSIGFVFFRGETDAEKYVIIKPQTVADATKALGDAAQQEYMKGGGRRSRCWMRFILPIISFPGTTAGKAPDRHRRGERRCETGYGREDP
jgi:hypothetical protein